MAGRIIYIHAPLNRSILPQPLRPKPGRRFQYLRGQSRGFVLLEKGYRRRLKLCFTSHYIHIIKVHVYLIFPKFQPLLGRAWRAIMARLKTSRRQRKTGALW